MNSHTPWHRGPAAMPLTMTALFLALAVGACKMTQPAATEVADGSSAAEPEASAVGNPEGDATEAPSGDSADEAAASPAGSVAIVNGEPVPMAEFQKQAFDTQRYHVDQGGIDPNSADGQQKLLFLRRQVLRDMIDQKLMEQAAEELKVSVTDEELDAEMKSLIEEVGGQAAFVRKLAEAQTSKAEWLAVERASMVGRKVLEAITADLPRTAEFVHARQIFCKERASCDAALARVENGEDFATVAKELSEDSSTRDRGGDLDWVTRGSLLSPELEEVVFGLQTGEHSAVVSSDLGFHIVAVLERDPARVMSDEQLMPLRERKLTEWLTQRRAASTIEIQVEDLKDVNEGQTGGNG